MLESGIFEKIFTLKSIRSWFKYWENFPELKQPENSNLCDWLNDAVFFDGILFP